MDRETVYSVINSERDYQEWKWAGVTTGGAPGARTIGEYTLYIASYTNDLVSAIAHNAGDNEMLDTIRKITALGVAAMEEHEAHPRSLPVYEDEVAV